MQLSTNLESKNKLATDVTDVTDTVGWVEAIVYVVRRRRNPTLYIETNYYEAMLNPNFTLIEYSKSGFSLCSK